MYSKEFYSELEKAKKEYFNTKLLIESIHPIDIINNKEQVLEEASMNMQSIKKAAMRIIEAGIKALNKFIKMTSELEKRNNKIIDGYKKVDTNLVDFNNFEYFMPDVEIAFNRIKSFTPPMFDKNDADLLLNNNSISYKIDSGSKFPEGLFLEDGSINKSFFRGLVSNTEVGKIKVTQTNASKMFKACLNVLDDRMNTSKKIEGLFKSSLKISEQIIGASTNQTITESSLLDLSIFKDEYYDILFEDAITTTQTIQKEIDPKNIIKTDTAENRETSNNDKIANAVLRYSEIMNSIFAEIMNSLDILYNESGKYCAKVSQLSNKKNK